MRGIRGLAHLREGKTKTEMIRWLKRYIAREFYHALLADLTPAGPPPSRIADRSCPPAVPDQSATRSALDIYGTSPGQSTNARRIGVGVLLNTGDAESAYESKR